jgi:hypothetical protein
MLKVPNLPHDLTKITKPQYRSAVCYLANKPIDELRKHQIQIRQAEKRARRANNRAALDSLYVMDRIAADAVFEHEFGPAICRRPKRR